MHGAHVLLAHQREVIGFLHGIDVIPEPVGDRRRVMFVFVVISLRVLVGLVVNHHAMGFVKHTGVLDLQLEHVNRCDGHVIPAVVVKVHRVLSSGKLHRSALRASDLVGQN